MHKIFILATAASMVIGTAASGPAQAQNYSVGQSSGTYSNAPPPAAAPAPPPRRPAVAAVRG